MDGIDRPTQRNHFFHFYLFKPLQYEKNEFLPSLRRLSKLIGFC